MARSITTRSTNPKIMDDNILKLEEAIEAADVSANPEGTAEETLLTTIGIDGKKYDIGASAENVSYDNTDSGLTADDVQAAIDEVLGKIQPLTVLNTVLSDSTGWSSVIPFPTGYTIDTTYILGLLIEDPNGWRSAYEGLGSEATEKIFPEIVGAGIRVYNNLSTYYGKDVKVVVVKL